MIQGDSGDSGASNKSPNRENKQHKKQIKTRTTRPNVATRHTTAGDYPHHLTTQPCVTVYTFFDTSTSHLQNLNESHLACSLQGPSFYGLVAGKTGSSSPPAQSLCTGSKRTALGQTIRTLRPPPRAEGEQRDPP